MSIQSARWQQSNTLEPDWCEYSRNMERAEPEQHTRMERAGFQYSRNMEREVLD